MARAKSSSKASQDKAGQNTTGEAGPALTLHEKAAQLDGSRVLSGGSLDDPGTGCPPAQPQER